MIMITRTFRYDYQHGLHVIGMANGVFISFVVMAEGDNLTVAVVGGGLVRLIHFST